MTTPAPETIDGAAPFDPTTLAPEPAALPPIGTDDPPMPDHTAGTGEVPPPPDNGGLNGRRPTARERVRLARERAGNTATPDAPKVKRADVPPMSEAKLTKALTQVYVTAGIGVMPFDPTCANVVVTNAEKCARSLAVAAQTNPALRRALIALTETGAWGGVMIAHLPILAAVAWHHSPSPAIRDGIAPLAAALAGIDTVALMRDAEQDDPQ